MSQQKYYATNTRIRGVPVEGRVHPMPTIRVSDDLHSVIRELANGESMQGVISKAIELYRRQALLEKANAAFAALRQDPAAWAQEQAERAEWDGKVGDTRVDTEFRPQVSGVPETKNHV